MTIIDAQVHVWLPETPDRPWPPGGAARVQLPYALDYTKLLMLMDEAGVDRAILVPPSWEGERNDHALEAAARYPNRFAVMGRMAPWTSRPTRSGCAVGRLSPVCSAFVRSSCRNASVHG